MRRRPIGRDRGAWLMVLSGAIFIFAGIWLLGQPDAVLLGLLGILFFGAVLAVGIARLRTGPRGPLPPWAVLVGSAGFSSTCLVLLIVTLAADQALTVGGLMLTVACVLGLLLFGVGGIAYAIRHARRAGDRPSDPPATRQHLD